MWTVELPSDQKPVGLFACVEAICHRAVEVDQVLARPGSELGQVEIRVAANQGIGRPLDGRDSALEAPAALILLEGEPNARNLLVRDDAKDVRVHVKLVRGSRSQPSQQAADHAAVDARAGDIVTRVSQRSEQVGIDRRLVRPLPDRREQCFELAQLRELVQLADDRAGGPHLWASACVSTPASRSAARTAAAVAAAPLVSPWMQMVS